MLMVCRSLVAGGILALLASAWAPLPFSLSLAIGCLANYLRNRSYYDIIKSPLFVAVAALFPLSDSQVLSLRPGFILGIGSDRHWHCLSLEWNHLQKHS
jgi:hypothetical protein